MAAVAVVVFTQLPVLVVVEQAEAVMVRAAVQVPPVATEQPIEAAAAVVAVSLETQAEQVVREQSFSGIQIQKQFQLVQV
jgi:hypothetical protein